MAGAVVPAAEAKAPRLDLHRAAALTGLLFAGAALRLPALGMRELVEGDGVHYASLARAVLIGDFSALANPYWSNLWPGVIAGTSLLSGLDVVGAGRMASLLAGVALCALTALFASRMFGPVEGALAGLAVAAHPWLIQFSTLVFTESFFSLLLVAILFAGWRAIEVPSAGRWVAAGALAGAGLVTRPETHGLVAVLAGLLLLTGRRRWGPRAAARALAVFLSVAAAFVGARAILIHHHHGEWDFGHSKGAANLFLGLQQDKERAAREILPGGENRLASEMERWSAGRFMLAHPGLVLRHAASNLPALAGCALRVFPPLPVTLGREAFRGTPLWTAIDVAAVACLGLAAFGLVHGVRGRGTRPAAGLCGAVIGTHLAGLAPLLVHERMIVAVVPVFLVLLAHGAVALAAIVARRPLRLREGILFFPPLAAVTLFGQLRSPSFDYASEPVVQKQAGLWLRERFPQTARLMTISPSIAFYFYDAEHQDNETDLPWAEYPALLEHARREAVDVIAASEWQLEAAGIPAAGQLLPAAPHPGLAYVATLGREPRRVHVFRVLAAP